MPTSDAKPEARSPGLLSSIPQLHSLWNDLLDLVFPPRCVGCERVDTLWCPRCEADLVAYPFELTTRQIGRLAVVAATGTYQDKLQDAIQALKYYNVRSLKDPLTQRLMRAVMLLDWQPELIIPVPLHPNRQKTRGFNQAHLLAAALADHTGQDYRPEAIQRTRDTRPQVGLKARERLENVKDAFHAEQNAVEGRSILLIDDVCTTGATLAACAQAVRLAGAKNVYCLTVAMAAVSSAAGMTAK
ncbi:MAG: ComF family protein [Anaerolineae bacterium]